MNTVVWQHVMLKMVRKCGYLKTDQCDAKPELILKLEQGAGPWKEEDAPNQRLPAMENGKSLNDTSWDNQKRYLNYLVITGNSSTEERVKFGELFNMSSNHVLRLAIKNRNSSKMRSEVLDIWESVYLPSEHSEMQPIEELDPTTTRMSCGPPEPLSLDHRVESGQQHFQCSHHDEAFSMNSVWTHKVFPLGDNSTFHTKPGLVNLQSNLHAWEKACVCNDNEKCRKPHECNTSAKISKQPRRRHRCGRSYQCKVCGKAFKHTQNLYLHYRTHTGEKPYECNICGNAFKRRCDLTIHQRVHTGEKPYECKECRKTFSIKSGLIVHQRIHTGEKPFECKECRKSFSVKSYLTIHQKTHLGLSTLNIILAYLHLISF
ncbi:zinc finger protein 39 [Cricetulus griseus]|nr:zinc finger protein 39 [Cricetulus griseus]